MSEEYLIVDLEERHLPEILRICRRELGTDYHSEADFRKYMAGGEDASCTVIVDQTGTVCGFSVTMLLEPEPAHRYLKLPASDQRDRLLSVRRIGLLDSVATDHGLKGRGVGRLLVGAMLDRLLDQGAEVVCAMAWKSVHGVTNIAKLLLENGLEESLSVEGYWNLVVDTPEGHHCPVCQEPPCRCHGVLYVRYAE